MQQARYQRGSLRLEKRRSQPDVWTFRHYVEENGRRAYKKQIVGSVLEFPKRKDAEKAVLNLRVSVNEGAPFAPMTIADLIAHYRIRELDRLAFSTAEGYKVYLDRYILPQYGPRKLASIKPIEVEDWLRSLKKRDGKPVAPGTATKLRNMLSAIFAHAIRYGWASTNPIKTVRCSAKRQRVPDILTQDEFQALLEELNQRERVMVLLDGSTGIRRSELFALCWKHIDFDLRQASVEQSIYRNRIGECKTEASRKPVPLHEVVIQELRNWRAQTAYKRPEDFLFPSVSKNGSQPMQPDMILKRHIRPALKRIGVEGKRIGWHSFRHGLATMLRQHGLDLKTAQELLRHANSRITLEIYQQSVAAEKREAQNKVMGMLLAANDTAAQSNPSAPTEPA